MENKDITKQQMAACIEAHTQLDEVAFDRMLSIFAPLDLAPGQHLESPGVERSHIFLVLDGLLRYYYLGDDGKEWNKAFVPAGAISTSFSSDFLLRPSPYGIQALEKTSVMMAEYSHFETLYDENPRIERLGRKVVESILLSKMNRERGFLTDSAKQRYDDFARNNPSLLARIPQYHIASYLGVTEASLSRILRSGCE